MSISVNTCPLCGQSNSCAQTAPATATQPCWCFSAKIAPHVLGQVPTELKDRACLCPRCAQGLPPEHNA